MSDDDDPKTLMPEILPEPSSPSPSPPPRAAPRDRVLARMKKLGSVAAAAGTAVSLSYCVVDMLPDPAQCEDAGSDQWLNPSAFVGEGGTIEVSLYSAYVLGLHFVDATVVGAEILERSPPGPLEDGPITLRLDPAEDSEVIEVHTLVSCGAGGERVGQSWRLRLDPQAAQGDMVQIEPFVP